tara:strand:+ start:487 stop:1482 length:996 start_codon:yes stop_codon:yes gene_type:complete
MILITGGAGFIGSNFILNWIKENDEPILNYDNLTYASNLKNLSDIEDNKNYFFLKGDINDKTLLNEVLLKYKPRSIINFAAETHVDNSIASPEAFISSNIIGTFNLLTACLEFYLSLSLKEKERFRFLHVSTDEVFGSLELKDEKSSESSPYRPNSPYSASKAASDHLVRAWAATYNLPINITNCTNNYGPHQHTEKLIPLLISNCLNWKKLPIYGDGKNIRDWLFVTDHCEAIGKILEDGKVGETYNIGGNNQTSNLEIALKICIILDRLSPNKKGNHSELIEFVEDRPGHDFRYNLDTSKIEKELNWKPAETFDSGLEKTIKWYLHKNL